MEFDKITADDIKQLDEDVKEEFEMYKIVGERLKEATNNFEKVHCHMLLHDYHLYDVKRYEDGSFTYRYFSGDHSSWFAYNPYMDEVLYWEHEHKVHGEMAKGDDMKSLLKDMD